MLPKELDVGEVVEEMVGSFWEVVDNFVCLFEVFVEVRFKVGCLSEDQQSKFQKDIFSGWNSKR